MIKELDLIDDEDQITHTITLEDAQDPENGLSKCEVYLCKKKHILKTVFHLDPDFEKNETIYEEIRKEIIGDPNDSSDDDDDADENDDDDDEQKAEGLLVFKTVGLMIGFVVCR